MMNTAAPPGCAHRATVDFQRLVAAHQPPADDQDHDDARRGFIGTVPDADVTRADGNPVWNLAAYGFLDSPGAPDTVNPILWRQARLNREHGLFQVTGRIFQVRGFDIANITFIETEHGVIALDALTCPETASAALALYRRHRGERPLHTVIYSHSHADHFGGVAGLVSEEDVRAGRVQIIAPALSLFMQCAVAENVMAGVAMARRAQFQFGHTLPIGPAAQVDSGLGKNMPRGRPSLIAPTREIKEAHEVHVIDGLEIEFQLTPETEAPAEMHLFIPKERALNLAENAPHTLHNLCPLRGAKVRDSLA
jgi:alkyl sulfatase BDS1-like metallo-beta-lactamase superfamily hydrolase